MILSIQTLIWGQKHQQIHIKYPLNWWEAVKLRFMPSWFIRRYPIVCQEHLIEPSTLFPNIVAPKGQLHTHFLNYQEYTSNLNPYKKED